MTIQLKLCALCNQNPVTFNSYVCQPCVDKATGQEKAALVLEGSERYEWGLVKLTPGTINHIPQDSQLVGYWHKWGEGTYWVSLNEPVKALMDRATLLHAEIARRRELELPLLGPLPKPRSQRSVSAKPKEAPKEEDTQSAVLQDLSALRNKLLGKT